MLRHYIDGNAKWIGHRRYIDKVSMISVNLLSKLRQDKLSAVEERNVSVYLLVAANKLLSKLKHPIEFGDAQ